jgi:biopolymer transport protein TolR
MSFSMPAGGPRGPQMNVTPLIDVLLVLLIIFMVVVIEQRPTGLKAEIPQPAPQPAVNIPPPVATIVLHVKHTKSQDGHPEVKVNDELVPWESPSRAIARYLRHPRRAHRIR